MARAQRPGRAPRPRQRRRRGRRWALLVVAVVVALVAASAVAYRAGRLEVAEPWVAPALDRAERALGLGDDADTGPTPTAEVAPPAGLDLPALTAPAAVAQPVTGLEGTSTPLPDAVRRAVLAPLRDPDLGRRVQAVVTDLVTGADVVRRGDATAIPASTTKVLTAVAALEAVGPETRFSTRVVAGGPGTVVLVGGGDPFLERAPSDPADPDAPPYPPRADVTTLAQQVAAALLARGTTAVSIGYDASLFAGPSVNPAWRADYVPDGVVSPITALWTDEGREADGSGRVADPAAAAAADFAAALAAAGVAVTAPPVPGVAAPGGEVLGEVTSAPLREIVQRVLEASDNEAAEVLAHHVALARGLPAGFTEAAAAVTAVLAELGVPTPGLRLTDGSGLSRRNLVDPTTLTGALRAAADPAHPRLETLLPGLPVAGFTGSLADRFAVADPAGRGVVRAKTGTLTGVDSLAGVVVDATGHPYLFALLADRVGELDALEAEAALDAAAAGLAACTCSTPAA